MIGLYVILIIIVVIVVAVIVAPSILSPVGDIVAESVFDPVRIVCHIDHSVRLLPDDPSIGPRLENTPPRRRFVKRFRDIFLGTVSVFFFMSYIWI